jgi:hypothetical protein
MTEVTKSCKQRMMWPKNIAEIYGSMVVESKVSGSPPAAVLENRGLSVAKHSQCSKVVHRRYIGDVSNSELQKRTVVF